MNPGTTVKSDVAIMQHRFMTTVRFESSRGFEAACPISCQADRIILVGSGDERQAAVAAERWAGLVFQR